MTIASGAEAANVLSPLSRQRLTLSGHLQFVPKTSAAVIVTEEIIYTQAQHTKRLVGFKACA